MWLAILFSYIPLIILIILHYKRGKGKIGSLILDFIKLQLGQSSSFLRDVAMNDKVVYSLLFIWILSSTILAKCFTSLLLNTYFIRKPSLTVETLEDIVSNPGLSVSGKRSLIQIKSFKPEIYDILNKRLKEYESGLGIDSGSNPNAVLGKRVIQDVLNRKTVLMLTNYDTIIIKNFHPRLMESQHKAITTFEFSYISKHHKYYTKIYSL